MLAYVLTATAQPESTVAGIVAAVAGVITALAVLVGALTVFVPVLRSTRRVEKEVSKVHTIVNQQHTDQLRYQAALQQALYAHGIDIPVDQSLPIPEPPGGFQRRATDHKWEVEPEKPPATGPTTITLTGEMTEGDSK